MSSAGSNRSDRPTSTYRLQIHRDFTLFDAAQRLPYLHALGADAVYLSPLLRATAGSNHGYDVVDHRMVDPERGGAEGLSALAAEAAECGLKIVVDIVPNHMGVADATQNPAWWELLRRGRDGWSGDWFDVDWAHPGRILLPVLGDDFDPARDLAVEDGELRYYEHRFPIAPGTEHGTPADIHQRQYYELVNFRRADTEQNYRRFFAVTELAGLRVQQHAVFDATHAEILRWVSEHGVTGIRIDHPDGLTDPEGYLHSLRHAAGDVWITVEKITEPGERLPHSWPVQGMTGYDALAEVNGVLVDPSSAPQLDRAYRELTHDERDWQRHIEDGKRHVATTILQAEVRRLARLVTESGTALPAADSAPEFSDVVAALTELIIAFPVYRSYLPQGEQYLSEAVSVALARRAHLAGAIEAVLPRLRNPDDELAQRFQQATGAVMAKGVEDTAYYRYTRLISANEVGGDPGTVGLSTAQFHASQARRNADAPFGMTTLSTHDTKRGEDIRARIAVLPELMREWESTARQLMELAPIPNRSFAYLLWQTAVATGLIDRERLHAYAEKAMREASEGTRWIDPDTAFEAAVHAAVDASYDRPEVRALVEGMHSTVIGPGHSNSLAQKLIQLTMPGIPDVYQGSESLEDSLVDPDNRRPVDFTERQQLLAGTELATVMDGFAVGAELSAAEMARQKLWVTTTALHARRQRADSFTSYTALLASGPAEQHLLSFDRGGAITVATRLPVGLAGRGGWTTTTLTLPEGNYRDLLTGQLAAGQVRLSELLGQRPVALLIRA